MTFSLIARYRAGTCYLTLSLFVQKRKSNVLIIWDIAGAGFNHEELDDALDKYREIVDLQQAVTTSDSLDMSGVRRMCQRVLIP